MKAMATLAGVLALAGLTGAAAAQDAMTLGLGGDVYIAGADVETTADTDGDAFLAGAGVRLGHRTGGTAHLAGRRVASDAPVGGSLYAIGQIVTVTGGVTGSASLAGAEVTVSGPIGGNLRAGAGALELSGDVSGSALLAGETVMLSAAISGDARIAAEEIRFGDGARIGGRLVLYVPDPDEVSVPERVAAADRVEIREAEEAGDDMPEMIREAGRHSVRAAVLGFVWGVIVVAALSALAVAVAPDTVASVRRAALARPGRAILAGFAGLSFLVGSGFVLALTLVGLLLLPATLLVSGLAAVTGYLAGSYILGVALWLGAGQAMPPAWPGKSGLAVLGAFTAALAGLVPVIGWIAVLGLVFLGLGGIVLHLLARRRTG